MLIVSAAAVSAAAAVERAEMMKRAIEIGIVAGAACLLAGVASAQGPGPGGPVGIAAGMQQQSNFLKNNLTQAAEVVPEAGYGQKVGTMGEVRTYGQVIGHVANAQFGQCSGAFGVPNPNQGINLEDATKSRADLIKALADSFALCDKAFAGAHRSERRRDDPERPRRPGRARRRAARRAAHGNEMYGISTVYQRAQNIVPPSTAARGRGRGGRGNWRRRRRRKADLGGRRQTPLTPRAFSRLLAIYRHHLPSLPARGSRAQVLR